MRKVLLSVMTVGFLLAFNACKKGDQGPIGPAGPTGAAGAAGAVGPAGAAGADGSKILTGAGAPAAATGANGDFYFDSTAKSLYGPKAGGAWPATGVVLSGPAGATGATGAPGATGPAGAPGATGMNGTKFLAGAGAPTAAIGAEGDFYFDTETSVFYGPKGTGATPWAASAGSNVMPLGRAYAAKTFYLTRGFESVALVANSMVYGETTTETLGPINIFSSYTVTANDMIRINQYGVAGWAKNREMIFETNPGSGVWNAVPQSAAQLGVAPFVVGAKFRYSENMTNPAGASLPIAEFTLTQNDIDRLQVDNGAAFGYLTYAQADPTTVAEGKTLNFHGSKNIQVTQSTSGSNYRARYTAQTRINLNTIPGLTSNIEKYKQEGKVFVKYRYFSSNAAGNNPVSHGGTNAGWVDITPYANSYVKATSYGVDNSGTNPTLFPGPFNAPAYSSGMGNPFTGGPNFMGTGSIIGADGVAVTLAPNQIATATTLPSTLYSDGEVVINWNIASGTNFAGTATSTPFGPMTLTNPNNDVEDINAAGGTWTIVRDGERVPRTFETTYYSAPNLTSNRPVSATGFIDVVNITGGQPAAYFTGTKLVQVQVMVIPGDVVTTAKAKGVDVNNADALSKYISNK